jgi:hypothetical protein
VIVVNLEPCSLKALVKKVSKQLDLEQYMIFPTSPEPLLLSWRTKLCYLDGLVERPRPTECHRAQVIQSRSDDVVQVYAEQLARPHSKTKERTDRAD